MGPVLRILVVDDDALITHTLAGALADACEAQVWSAGSGEEGARLAALHRPDLILMDLDMPGVDGRDVCRDLRRQEALSATTIWILTGLTRESPLVQEAATLADRVLQKPVSLQELIAAIQETITPRGPRLQWA